MAWNDKTRKLTLDDPDNYESSVTYNGDVATVTVTQFSPYKSGKSNKQVVLKLDAWFFLRFADTLDEMLLNQQQAVDERRARFQRAAE